MKKPSVLVFILFFVLTYSLVMAVLLKVGVKAPDFSQKDQNGKTVTLSEFSGKSNVVLYFYPKDFTGGCTAEACSFRDNYAVFMKKDAVVIGVSFDSDESHVKFTKANKLPYSLISDTQGALGKKYGVPKFMGTMSDRVTFLIDKKGVIRYVYQSVKDATMHVENSLKELDKLQAPAKGK
jgi:peroxiredoxin Q/BCP